MKKNDQDKINRIAFIQLAIDNPIEAADVLIKKAKQLKNTKGSQQSVNILKDLLFVSDQTIWKDYSKSL